LGNDRDSERGLVNDRDGESERGLVNDRDSERALVNDRDGESERGLVNDRDGESEERFCQWQGRGQESEERLGQRYFGLP
jgi:hypothetical protein